MDNITQGIYDNTILISDLIEAVEIGDYTFLLYISELDVQSATCNCNIEIN